MKTLLKPFRKHLTVWTLTSCLTTLHFSTLAQAQEGADLKMDASLPVKTRPILSDTLATPSLLLAPMRGTVLDFGFHHTQSEIQLKNLVGKADITEDKARGGFAMAFGPRFFAGVDIAYRSKKNRADFALMGPGVGAISEESWEGIGDPTVKVGTRLNMSRFSLIGTLDYLIVSGKSETQLKSAQVEESNGRGGGGELTPKLSIFTNRKASMLFGGSVSYRLFEDRKTHVKDPSGFISERVEKGGNAAVLEAFIETPTDYHSVGGLLSYSKSEESKKQSLWTKTVPGSELVAIAAYGNIRAMKTLSVIPMVGYQLFMNNKMGDTDLSSQNSYLGSLNLQLTF